MGVKAGYKQTEVGVIPEDWNVQNVSDVGKVVTGGTPSTSVSEYWNGDHPWITPTDIGNKRDMTISERMLTDMGLRAIRELPAHTVLVTCIASIGKNTILRKSGACNQQINAVIPNKSQCVEYLYYTFEAGKAKLLANAGTTATSIVSKSVFEKIQFAIPPLPEQQAIANALSDVDQLIASLDQLIAKKRDLKQAAMQQLLTGKTRLQGFSGQWEVALLGDLLTMKPTYGIVTAGTFISTGVPMIRGGDIKGGRIGRDLPFVTEEKSFEYGRTILRRDDVVMALVGYPGEAAIVPVELEGANISRAVGLFRLNKKVTPNYLVSFINSPIGRRIVLAPSAGSAQLVINLAALNKLQFRLPTQPEQVAIAKVLTDMDAELTELEQRRDKTIALKQGMMQELLTGRTRLV